MSREKKEKHRRLEISGIPLIFETIEELGIREILSRYIFEHGNAKVPPVDSLILLIVNIVLGRDPVYKLDQWFDRFDPNCLGLSKKTKKFLNDDRFGRALDKLYNVDRASLMTEIVIHMVKVIKLNLDQIHNDSTTQKGFGSFPGKTTSGFELKKGHSKEHRFDLKQLVFCLSVSADGAVPVHFKTYSGNRTDDTTHIETWNTLLKIVGAPDFLYVADCKVCTKKQLDYIVRYGGRVVTIIPKTWKSGCALRDELREGKKKLKKVLWKKKLPHQENQWEYFSLYSGNYQTPSGHKVYWIYSNQKKKRDRLNRENSMEECEGELTHLVQRMNSRSLKTKDQIQNEISKILRKHGVSKFYNISISEEKESSKVQTGRGRPGLDTQYKTVIATTYALSWTRKKLELSKEKNADGVFPLLSTDENVDAKSALQAYKYQPNIEKRFTHYRSEHNAGPLLFKKIERIEAIQFLYFISLIVQAVIERKVRKAMAKKKINGLPIYPEERVADSPTTFRILDFFDGISTYQIKQGNTTVKWFKDELNKTQKNILKLLGMTERDYWKNCAAS